MNRTFLSRIREQITPRLDPKGRTGALPEAHRATIVALFHALTADATALPGPVLEYVDRNTRTTPGLLDEFVKAAELLDAKAGGIALAGSRRDSARFAGLAPEAKDRVLASILWSFPHPQNEATWRRRLHVVSENVEMLVGGRARRSFRTHVVRFLLTHYYTTAEGWDVVSYKEYPGRVRAEWEPCEVRSVREQDNALVLELSDGCFEELSPSALEPDERTELAVRTKAGRQRATFSRAAYLALAERLEMSDNGWVLTIGTDRHEVLK